MVGLCLRVRDFARNACRLIAIVVVFPSLSEIAITRGLRGMASRRTVSTTPANYSGVT